MGRLDNIILFDGALGTEVMRRGLDPKEDAALLYPNILLAIHKDYVESGCSIITANTFLANRLYGEFSGVKRDIRRSNVEAVRLAKQAALGTRVKVFGDIGPTGQFLEPYGEFTEGEFVKNYTEQVEALLEGGVDGFIIETMLDVNEAFCAAKACKEAAPELPVILSVVLTGSPNGPRTLMGHSTDDIVRIAEKSSAYAVGVNCVSLEEAAQAVRELKKRTSLPVLAQPNAGRPEMVDGKPVYKMGPQEFLQGITRCLDFGASIVGGCCGTTPAHIKVLHDALNGKGRSETT